MKKDDAEWQQRVNFAACFRLLTHFGWSDPIFSSHCTVRIPGDQDHLLVNPFNLVYSRMSASKLLKVKLNLEDGGGSDTDPDPGGLVLQRAIHQARPDVKCVIHLHTVNSIAVTVTEKDFVR